MLMDSSNWDAPGRQGDTLAYTGIVALAGLRLIMKLVFEVSVRYDDEICHSPLYNVECSQAC